jgi:hypothetical protein
LLKLKALSLSDISFTSPTDKKIVFSNNATNSNRTDGVFLSAGGTSGSVSNKVTGAINNFASNNDGRRSSNRSANSGANSNRLITSDGNAINSIINNKEKGLIKNKSVI